MTRREAVLCLALLGWSAAPAPAQVAETTADRTKEAARIESDCGLKKGSLTVHGDGIWLNPSQDEPYEHVDCAVARLRTAELGPLGLVGNEADPNAVLRPPLRYIAEGTSAQISALVKAATADGWKIAKAASAADGTVIVRLESGPAMTNGQADKLLDRIWKNEFSDIAFGLAPRRLSEKLDDE